MIKSAAISRDPAILGGHPVFRGTRVPVETLLENLADGMTVDEVLESYPTLNREDLILFITDLSCEAIAQSAVVCEQDASEPIAGPSL